MKDHGRFIIQTPHEAALIQSLIERAAANEEKPGHAWVRVVADATDAKGAKSTGILQYHLDANLSIVEVVETWNGVETARRTQPMAGEWEN